MVLGYKKVLMIVLILFVSGCTAEYNLTIFNDKLEEEFYSKIYNSEIPRYTVEGIELDDQITPFINQDHHPFFNNNEVVYNKEIIDKDNYKLVKLNYVYTKEDYAKSTVLKKCFENVVYNYSDNYQFDLSGAFYCLYNEKLDINVTTNNKVLSNNADDINGNTYIWHINRDNVNDVNISMEIQRNSFTKTVSNYSVIIVMIIGGAIITGIVMIIYIRRKKHNEL